MEINNYYKLLLNNTGIEQLNPEIYLDYQGEGYNLVEFKEVNPLSNVDKVNNLLTYSGEEFAFNFYTYNKDNTQMKAMDIMLIKDGDVTDHYLCHSTVADVNEINLVNKHNQEVSSEKSLDFMKRFWDGEEVKYASNYQEHSSFKTEITYENVIEIHSVNNYLVMMCDAKINGLYGTLTDLYVIENDEFVEHFDVFTVDLVQPPEIEEIC